MKVARVFFDSSRAVVMWWCYVAGCIVGFVRCQDNDTDRIMAVGQMENVFGPVIMHTPAPTRGPGMFPLHMQDDEVVYFRKNIVFESLDHVLNALTSMRNARFDQIQLLLDTFHKECKIEFDDTPVTERYPFISIEGPEASGSSIVSKWLSFKLDAFNLTNPPECLMKIRNEFDARQSTLRKVYYALGVWVNSELAKKYTAHRPVIINRYWRSMTAYGIAMENRRTGLPLPPPDSRIYRFPNDLTVPDFNFYVDISEHVRVERLAFRRQSMSSDLVNVINQVYSKFRKPPTLRLNGDKRVGDMLDEIARALNISYIR